MSRKVELAKSGRSSCKKCKGKIEKGELRVGTVSMRDDIEMTSWFHPACAPKKKGGITTDDFDGFDELSTEHQAAIEALCENNDQPSAKKPKVGDRDAADQDPNARELGFQAAYDKYVAMTIPDLKEWLDVNRQPKTGTKGELVSMCVDGELHGALTKCPMCEKGTLKRTPDGLRFECKGSYSEEMRTWRVCGFKIAVEKAERLEWRSPEDGPLEKPGSGGDGDGEGGAFVDPKDYEGLAVRDAADKLVKWARGVGLTLSEDDDTARLAAGTALTSTKTDDDALDPVAAAKELRRKFPSRNAEKVIKAAHSANGRICELLREYAELMERNGENPFAINGTRKALGAIMQLDYEIKDPKVLTAKATKVEGVGKGTVGVIGEILEKGTFDKLEEQRAKAASN